MSEARLEFFEHTPNKSVDEMFREFKERLERGFISVPLRIETHTTNFRSRRDGFIEDPEEQEQSEARKASTCSICKAEITKDLRMWMGFSLGYACVRCALKSNELRP